MVESTAVSCIHPNNNSVDRIISKEEEREDPRRDTSSLFRIQWCFHILQRTTRNPTSFQSSRAKKTILHTELILLQEFSKKYYNYKAHPVQIITRHLPVTAPCASKHSTWQNKAPGSLQHKQASSNSTRQNSILSGSQHPHSPYSSSQAHSYRILPGEIGFFPKKGQVLYIYTILRSVCSNYLFLHLE